ncbi:hypothetical protein HEK616_37110 [Streptomyces nigrescens]|uniref:Uncharacterized protein n=1 Tax=Streptomyces nigrescens TaxID=1920 RepID=A0ABM7ZV21_STRNI|nr:hypothetical protein HEK616_37110 [Streptomyces nigrescens]
MRAFPVVLPSGQKYWTVLDDDLEVVPVADRWLRNLRFGRDRAELTTKALKEPSSLRGRHGEGMRSTARIIFRVGVVAGGIRGHAPRRGPTRSRILP